MMKEHGITGIEWWGFETAPERFIREKEERIKQPLEEKRWKFLIFPLLLVVFVFPKYRVIGH